MGNFYVKILAKTAYVLERRHLSGIFFKDLDLIVKFVSFKLINLCKNQGYRLCKMSDFPW